MSTTYTANPKDTVLPECVVCKKTIGVGESYEPHRIGKGIIATVCKPCANEFKYTYRVCKPDGTWEFLSVVISGRWRDERVANAEEALLAALGLTHETRNDCTTPQYRILDANTWCYLHEIEQTWRSKV